MGEVSFHTCVEDIFEGISLCVMHACLGMR